jgi:ribosomal protein S25
MITRMVKSKYGKRYADTDFLEALPENEMITTAGIVKIVGCSHSVAGIHMRHLAEQGKVRKIRILGKLSIVWQKVI